MTQNEWTEVRKQFKKSPDKAFECLYNKMWSKLFSVSYNYVRNRAIAQEIVQDVFMNLWVKRERLQSVDDIRAFSLRALQNRVYDHFDKQAVQQKYALRVIRTDIEENVTQHQVEYDETMSIIDSELQKLPRTTSSIFRMSRFDRFSNEQIASMQQVSVKAVEYHITQALKHLRLRMKHIITILLLILGLG